MLLHTYNTLQHTEQTSNPFQIIEGFDNWGSDYQGSTTVYIDIQQPKWGIGVKVGHLIWPCPVLSKLSLSCTPGLILYHSYGHVNAVIKMVRCNIRVLVMCITKIFVSHIMTPHIHDMNIYHNIATSV